MALSDLFQATLETTYNLTGEKLENVFFFRKATGLGTAATLADAMLATDGIIEVQSSIISDQATISLLTVLNLGDPEDFDIRPLLVSGGQTGDVLPMFNALNVTLRPGTRSIRPGSKRIGPLSEENQIDGAVTGAPFIAIIADYIALMDDEIDDGGGITFKQVVIKRVFVAADPPDHGPYYRLPADEETPVVGDVIAAFYNPRLSHQVSRGNGR